MKVLIKVIKPQRKRISEQERNYNKGTESNYKIAKKHYFPLNGNKDILIIILNINGFPLQMHKIDAE